MYKWFSSLFKDALKINLLLNGRKLSARSGELTMRRKTLKYPCREKKNKKYVEYIDWRLEQARARRARYRHGKR